MGARQWGLASIAVLLLASPASVGADEIDVASLPDITNRMYALDVYQGSVLGSIRLVGMGGAQVAIAEGATGMGSNPAAGAVRSATSNKKWDWDWYVDWLNPDLASDFDNNGILTTETPDTAPVVALGVLGFYKKWGFGVTTTIQNNPTTIGDTDNEIEPGFLIGRVVLARTFMDDKLTAGVGVRFGTFEMKQKNPTVKLFEITGSGLEVGAIWRPHWTDLRVGGSISLPIRGTQVRTGGCTDPNDCEGYILPERVEVPWRMAVGVGYRLARTRWNRQVYERWRDEQSLMVAADLVLFGPTENAYGLEAFVKKKLQRSGKDLVASARVGVEYEWLPGRLRVRGGSYWEPGRFSGVGGRMHATGGLDVRVWDFRFWGKPYRVRLSATGDFASKYANAGVSVGFWH